MPAEPTLIGSVQRALHLLEAVGASDRPVSAKSLARALDLALPTTYHLLRTLVHEGYLRKLEDGYVLGDQVGTLRQGNTLQAVLGRMRPILRGLRDQMRAAAYLALYQDGEIRLLDVVDGPAVPRVDLWVGLHESGHATAFGKCILSVMDKPGRDEYLSRHRLADLTPHTITDPRILERRLGQPHDYVDDREEYQLGTVCVAAPIRVPGGVLGAVAISVSARRYPTMAAGSVEVIRTARRATTALAVSSSGGAITI